jgi:hypothetical protein
LTFAVGDTPYDPDIQNGIQKKTLSALHGRLLESAWQVEFKRKLERDNCSKGDVVFAAPPYRTPLKEMMSFQ